MTATVREIQVTFGCADPAALVMQGPEGNEFCLD